MTRFGEGRPIYANGYGPQKQFMVYTDSTAAFDTVYHNILLDRLVSCLGVTGSALAWFRSYLSDRYQFVNIKGERSSCPPLYCGLPQGSLLIPILYLLHTWVSTFVRIIPSCARPLNPEVAPIVH